MEKEREIMSADAGFEEGAGVVMLASRWNLISGSIAWGF
jgi:hypothetical protein